jgi:hypothetical protein
VAPTENASGVAERWTPFAAYPSKELGLKVNAHRQRLRRYGERAAGRLSHNC